MSVILQILTFQLVDLLQKQRHLETIQKIIRIVPFTQHYGLIEARQIPIIKLNFEKCCIKLLHLLLFLSNEKIHSPFQSLSWYL